MPARPSSCAPAAKAARSTRRRRAFGKRKAVLYATCFVNFNNTDIGAARARGAGQERRRDRGGLSRAAAACRKLELGDLAGASPAAARQVSRGAAALDRQGLRRDRAGAVLRADAEVRMAADPARGSAMSSGCRRRPSISPNTSSTSPRRRAWRPACSRSKAASALHLACHARAQNMGAKARRNAAADAQTRVAVIERCSGHGGIWGARDARISRRRVKVGKPARAGRAEERHRPSLPPECPLAADHLMQVMEMTARGEQKPKPLARRPSDRARWRAPMD